MTVRGPADQFELGTWNAVCSICGRKAKANTLVKNWMGMYRHSYCNDPRQPQDFVRGIPDIPTPSWTQPMPADVFVYFCTPNGTTGTAGWAVAGCALPNYIAPGFDPNAVNVA